ncbi:MAG: ornithine cyclodeaminase family protein [Acidobacteria bacterium]|nr:ornithine cyclodeaminase family protein [Acidobacteriota bacterium]
MALLISEEEVKALLPMNVALEAIEECFRRMGEGRMKLQLRHRLELPEKGFLHYMAAADMASNVMGMKIYTSVAGSLRFVVPLYRASTGELLALIEANHLGQIRTGAASGVATKHMARPEAKTVGILGTGFQAKTQLEAIAGVRNLLQIRAFGRDKVRRDAFAKEMTQRLRVPVEPVESAEAAVRDADVVVTATSASRPVLLGTWLAPGTHINAVGANFPQKHELDEEAVARAGIIVADSREQSKVEAGDLIHVLGADAGRWTNVKELSDIVTGLAPGRTSERQITLFKSNGIATEDVAVAMKVYEAAVRSGAGKRVTMWGED